MKRSKDVKSKILGKLLIIIAILLSIIFGGYLFLDKVIIPSKFGDYGIGGISDLLGVINSLYKNPEEDKLITNGYSSDDEQSSVQKLKIANYNIDENDKIVLENLKTNATQVELTDREFCAICNKVMKDKVLDDATPKLKYIVLSNVSVLQLNIDIDGNSLNGEVYEKAKINFTSKIITTTLKQQISEQMETPLSLLNIIIPEELYFTIYYDIDLSKTDYDRIGNGKMAINGRTEKQSEVLIDLLVDFVFSKEENMGMNKFVDELASTILQGIDVFGEFKFKQVDNRNGILIIP